MKDPAIAGSSFYPNNFTINHLTWRKTNMTTTTLDNRMRVSGRITRIETISQIGAAMAASLRSAGLIGDSPDVTAVYVEGVPVLFDGSAESWPTVRRALGSGISSMEAYGEYMSANLASVRLPGASSCMPSPDFVLFPHRDRTGNPALDLDLVITGRNIEDRPRTREVGSPGHCLTCDDLVLRTDVRAVALAHGEHRTDVDDDGSIGRCTRCFGEVLRVDPETQAERDFVTTAAHRMGVVSVDTLEHGVPAPVLVHWARPGWPSRAGVHLTRLPSGAGSAWSGSCLARTSVWCIASLTAGPRW